jgi:MFS family permease
MEPCIIVGAAVNILVILAGLSICRVETSETYSWGGGFRELLGKDNLPVLVTFFTYMTLLLISLRGVNQIIPLYLDSRFTLSESQIGLFITAQSLIMLVTQMPSGNLADRYGIKRTLLTILVSTPFLLASWHFIDDWRIMLVLNSLAFGLWSMTWSAILTLLSNAVPSSLVGPAFGLNTTGDRLGQTIGPLIAGYFYVNYFPTSPFLVEGMICLIAVLVAYRIKETV